MAEAAPQRSHRRVRMFGRDPDESHRAATPLELLFDLTFVVAFGVAGNELAHFLAEEHIAGIGGFAGVLVFALGIPNMFDSLGHGGHVDNTVMVLGYVVMRVPMVFQWARAARQDPGHARACRIYIATAVWFVVLILVEMAGPVLAETRGGGTPCHAHHIRSATACWSSSRSARA